MHTHQVFFDKIIRKGLCLVWAFLPLGCSQPNTAASAKAAVPFTEFWRTVNRDSHLAAEVATTMSQPLGPLMLTIANLSGVTVTPETRAAFVDFDANLPSLTAFFALAQVSPVGLVPSEYERANAWLSNSAGGTKPTASSNLTDLKVLAEVAKLLVYVAPLKATAAPSGATKLLALAGDDDAANKADDGRVSSVAYAGYPQTFPWTHACFLLGINRMTAARVPTQQLSNAGAVAAAHQVNRAAALEAESAAVQEAEAAAEQAAQEARDHWNAASAAQQAAIEQDAADARDSAAASALEQLAAQPAVGVYAQSAVEAARRQACVRSGGKPPLYPRQRRPH